MKYPGKYILFEGGEGAGKGENIKHCAEWLESLFPGQVVTTREPGGTELGKGIRELLLNKHELEIDPLTELLLFSADRATHTHQVIIPSLNAGKWVLGDRGFPSTWVYQYFASDQRGEQLTEEVFTNLIHLSTYGIEPNLILWYDIDPEIGLARKREKNRIDAKDIAYHLRVWKGYEDLFFKYPQMVDVIASYPLPQVIAESKSIIAERFKLGRTT